MTTAAASELFAELGEARNRLGGEGGEVLLGGGSVEGGEPFLQIGVTLRRFRRRDRQHQGVRKRRVQVLGLEEGLGIVAARRQEVGDVAGEAGADGEHRHLRRDRAGEGNIEDRIQKIVADTEFVGAGRESFEEAAIALRPSLGEPGLEFLPFLGPERLDDELRQAPFEFLKIVALSMRLDACLERLDDRGARLFVGGIRELEGQSPVDETRHARALAVAEVGIGALLAAWLQRLRRDLRLRREGELHSMPDAARACPDQGSDSGRHLPSTSLEIDGERAAEHSFRSTHLLHPVQRIEGLDEEHRLVRPEMHCRQRIGFLVGNLLIQ